MANDSTPETTRLTDAPDHPRTSLLSTAEFLEAMRVWRDRENADYICELEAQLREARAEIARLGGHIGGY